MKKYIGIGIWLGGFLVAGFLAVGIPAKAANNCFVPCTASNPSCPTDATTQVPGCQTTAGCSPTEIIPACSASTNAFTPGTVTNGEMACTDPNTGHINFCDYGCDATNGGGCSKQKPGVPSCAVSPLHCNDAPSPADVAAAAQSSAANQQSVQSVVSNATQSGNSGNTTSHSSLSQPITSAIQQSLIGSGYVSGGSSSGGSSAFVGGSGSGGGTGTGTSNPGSGSLGSQTGQGGQRPAGVCSAAVVSAIGAFAQSLATIQGSAGSGLSPGDASSLQLAQNLVAQLASSCSNAGSLLSIMPVRYISIDDMATTSCYNGFTTCVRSHTWISWSEIEVYDGAGNKINIASSSIFAGEISPYYLLNVSSTPSIANLVDGNMNTNWNSGYYQGGVRLDLGTSTLISKIRLLENNSPDPGGALTKILVSNNSQMVPNGTWITLPAFHDIGTYQTVASFDALNVPTNGKWTVYDAKSNSWSVVPVSN